MEIALSPRFFQRKVDKAVISISFRSKSSDKVKPLFEKQINIEKNHSFAIKRLRNLPKVHHLPQINLSPEVPCDKSFESLQSASFVGQANQKISKFFNRNALRFSKCFIQPMPYLQVLHCSYNTSGNRNKKSKTNYRLMPIHKSATPGAAKF